MTNNLFNTMIARLKDDKIIARLRDDKALRAKIATGVISSVLLGIASIPFLIAASLSALSLVVAIPVLCVGALLLIGINYFAHKLISKKYNDKKALEDMDAIEKTVTTVTEKEMVKMIVTGINKGDIFSEKLDKSIYQVQGNRPYNVFVTELDDRVRGNKNKLALESSRYNGDTILIAAIKAKDAAMVEYLVNELKLDVNKKSGTGEAPIKYAVEAMDADILSFLGNISILDKSNVDKAGRHINEIIKEKNIIKPYASGNVHNIKNLVAVLKAGATLNNHNEEVQLSRW